MPKRHRSSSPTQRFVESSDDGLRNTLHVQAYEATVIRSQPDTARRVTTQERDGQPGGLIRWMPDGLDDEEEIWVDRFDSRLLLTSMPRPAAATASPSNDPLANIGWDDLDSDSEDIFFMSSAEIEAFKADKIRREMEESRQKRMRALEEREAADRDPNDPAGWGGSDEEPDEKQRTLMGRTAGSISRSKNPQQLEMRILANHGSDPRFAFLRGRWRRTWEHVKAPPPPKPVATASTNFSGLADYAEDSNSENDERQSPPPELDSVAENGSIGLVTADLGKSPSESLETLTTRMERRERARLWAAKRRADSAPGPSA